MNTSLPRQATHLSISRVLVTGANGFVGQALTDALRAQGADTRAAVRTASRAEDCAVGSIGADTDWRSALAGRQAVVHLAARVHVMHDDDVEPLAAYRAVNTAGTIRLASQAAAAGVRRIVFVSTAKVYGETSPDTSFSGDTPAAPIDPYAISKWEGEQALHDIAARTGLEVVVLRPPLVYGPGVGANFLRLLRWVDRGYPLPFGAIHNRRSLVALSNLVSAIVLCLQHPNAAGRTFAITDGEDLSTPELIRRIAVSLNRRARLVAIPPLFLQALGRILGRGPDLDRLLSSFAVDSSPIRTTLGWQPPTTVDEALAETSAWYRSAAR